MSSVSIVTARVGRLKPHGSAYLTRLYADDTSLSYSSSELAEIIIKLNNDLKNERMGSEMAFNFNPAKKEVVIVSNIFHDYDLRLTYDDAVLNIVEIHKHLGIYLSASNIRTNYIDSIIMSASKQGSYLRKLIKQIV